MAAGLPAAAALMRASPFPNVADKGARFFEMFTRIKTLNAAGDVDAMGLELEGIMRGADPGAVPPVAGVQVFPAPAENTTEAAFLAVFQDAPQIMDECYRIVMRYAASNID